MPAVTGFYVRFTGMSRDETRMLLPSLKMCRFIGMNLMSRDNIFLVNKTTDMKRKLVFI